MLLSLVLPSICRGRTENFADCRMRMVEESLFEASANVQDMECVARSRGMGHEGRCYLFLEKEVASWDK